MLGLGTCQVSNLSSVKTFLKVRQTLRTRNSKVFMLLKTIENDPSPCTRCFDSVEPPTGCQFRMESLNTNKILGIVPKREFSVPKWQKYSQNGTIPRNLTPLLLCGFVWHPIWLNRQLKQKWNSDTGCERIRSKCSTGTIVGADLEFRNAWCQNRVGAKIEQLGYLWRQGLIWISISGEVTVWQTLLHFRVQQSA